MESRKKKLRCLVLASGFTFFFFPHKSFITIFASPEMRKKDGNRHGFPLSEVLSWAPLCIADIIRDYVFLGPGIHLIPKITKRDLRGTLNSTLSVTENFANIGASMSLNTRLQSVTFQTDSTKKCVSFDPYGCKAYVHQKSFHQDFSSISSGASWGSPGNYQRKQETQKEMAAENCSLRQWCLQVVKT